MSNITVLTPAYNRGKLLEKLYESLKITSGEISAKEAAEERIWAGRTPPAAAPGPGRSEE